MNKDILQMRNQGKTNDLSTKIIFFVHKIYVFFLDDEERQMNG